MARFKQPLTRADLAAIQARSQTPDARALLWEIARLRALVLRANQLQLSLGALAGGPRIVLDALRAELEGEPCIAEREWVDLSGNG